MSDIEEYIDEVYSELKEAQERNEIKEVTEDFVSSPELTKLAATQMVAELKVAKKIAQDVIGDNYRPVDVWTIFDTMIKTKLQCVFVLAGKEKLAAGKAPPSLDAILKSMPGSGKGGGFSGFN
jgi:D-alanyl-D-alanine dipeptidase